MGTKIAKGPSAKAIDVYSGVLYQALDYQNLNTAAKKRAEKSIVIISALFGAIKLTDSIPTYRLDMAKSLPKLGSLTALWKPVVTKALESIKTDLIIDCRSSTYQGVWTPELNKTVGIRVFTEKNGKRSVVTHMSKKTRGDVAKFLVMQSKIPKTAQELQKLVEQSNDITLNNFKMFLQDNINMLEQNNYIIELEQTTNSVNLEYLMLLEQIEEANTINNKM